MLNPLIALPIAVIGGFAIAFIPNFKKSNSSKFSNLEKPNNGGLKYEDIAPQLKLRNSNFEWTD